MTAGGQQTRRSRAVMTGAGALVVAVLMVASTGVAAPLRSGTPSRSVLLVGDSIASSLLPGLQAELAPGRVELSVASVPGCGVVRGVPVYPNWAPVPGTESCEQQVPTYQVSALEQARPDLVLWLSASELLDRLVDGLRLRVGSEAGDRRLTALLDDAVDRLHSTGARVAILLPVESTPAANLYGFSHAYQAVRISALRAVLRGLARRRPHVVSTIDLQPIVCPGGPPCAHRVDGLLLRPDGTNFGAVGARYVAGRIRPAIRRALPGAPIPATTRP